MTVVFGPATILRQISNTCVSQTYPQNMILVWLNGFYSISILENYPYL